MKNKLIKLAKQEGIELEIYETKTKRTDINLLNKEEKLFQIVNTSNYIIKAIINGKCIKFATGSIKNPSKVIENIKTIFAIQDNDNENNLSKGYINNKEKNSEKLDYNQVKKDLLSLNSLKENYPEIINVEINYSHYDKGYFIDNANCKMVDDGYYNEYSVGITASKNNTNKVSYISFYSKEYNFEEFYNYILKRIESLIKKLDGNSCITKKYDIILKNTAVSDILKTFASMFDTENIMLNESVLVDKYKKKVFSDKITIIEDPNGDSAILKRSFDSEGTKTNYKVIVDSGVFTKRINNIEYALKSKEEATGNAYGVNNLFIKPSDDTFEDLVSKLNNGIIIDEVMGVHSGIDVRSGNISVQAEGLLVEDGKITKGLTMIILSTNIFELFTNVVSVGNDLSKSSTSISAPSLLLNNITIVGKE